MFIVINNIRKEYENLMCESNFLGKLIASKTNEHDAVVISCRTSFEQIECFIGCIMYNRIPIIIPHPSNKVFPHEFQNKLEKINQAVHPSLCISDKIDEGVFNKHWPVISNLEYKESDDNLDYDFIKDSDEIAFTQLSSGTTGLPKVMHVTHNAIKKQCLEYGNVIDLNDNDVIISWLPLYHDMGLIATLMLPILHKVSFVHINAFDWLINPELLFQAIEKYKGTLTWLPNFAFSLLAKRCHKSILKLDTMRQWISCSEMTKYIDITKFAETFNKNGVTINELFICYALAENIFAVSHTNKVISSFKENVLSCGKILPGTSVFISPAGNVLIKSSYMTFPINKDENGYYDTGDIGFIKDNELYIKGRSDDMIISYGKNIFPYMIEHSICNLSNVISGRVACFGVYNDRLGTEKVHIVAECIDVTQKDTIKEINDIMISFDLTASIYLKSNGYIIKTSSGKIARKRTRDKLLNELKGAP